MKKVTINKGRYAVIKKGGKVLQTIEAVKALRIEGGDDCEIESKIRSSLTGEELAKTQNTGKKQTEKSK